MDFLLCNNGKIKINRLLFSIIKGVRMELPYLYGKSCKIRQCGGYGRNFYELTQVKFQIDYLSKQLRFLKALVKICQHVISCFPYNESASSCVRKFNLQVTNLFEGLRKDFTRSYNTTYTETLSGVVRCSFVYYVNNTENKISINHFPYWAALLIENGYGDCVPEVKSFLDSNVPEGFRFLGYGNCMIDDKLVLFGRDTISCTVTFVKE